MTDKHHSFIDVLIAILGYIATHFQNVMGGIISILTVVILSIRLWRMLKKRRGEDFEV